MEGSPTISVHQQPTSSWRGWSHCYDQGSENKHQLFCSWCPMQSSCLNAATWAFLLRSSSCRNYWSTSSFTTYFDLQFRNSSHKSIWHTWSKIPWL